MSKLSDEAKTVRVAAAQAEPVWGNLDATVDKTLNIIRDAASKGVELLALPELWIPGYPFWIWSLPAFEWSQLWPKYIENSLRVDSPQMMALRRCCEQHKIWVNVGFSEREGSSLYMSTCWITDKGDIAGHRRKIMPTGTERVIFGQSSGDSLENVIESPFGKIGSLMCWEHAQPLLKYHTASQGEEIHVASWPYLFPKLHDDMHWGMTPEGCIGLSRAYAAEAGTFVLLASNVMSRSGAKLLGFTEETMDGSAFVIPGGGASRILGPDGRLLAGEGLPMEDEGLVIADIDVRHVIKAKTLMDGVGHYSRPDLLSLSANKTANSVISSRETSHAIPYKAVSRYPPFATDGRVEDVVHLSGSGEDVIAVCM